MLWARIQHLEMDGWKVDILKTFENGFKSPITPLPLPLLVIPMDSPVKAAYKFDYQPKFFVFDDSVDKEVI